MYDAEQILDVGRELNDMLTFWEYNQGKTCFFYGLVNLFDKTDSYRKHNAAVLMGAAAGSSEDREVKQFSFADPSKQMKVPTLIPE
mmetsp:Transcript_1765/g.2487  ORF Transcript_1765/g.2487 Transcript_1765/m.2487 type:complete len:86 (+) Transcript_1765:496-753(+)|eukprot:CAMPEP_0185591342 /NCGR_PEP_ID=MMETSP0434-20130131/64150_1 /TAXON_ID=626734 ORGANISM="Favella taraikaensis, Strain Fe Narragansett Bay" /NCGR_SAMPLE_ID=MMETSP0434 /ASSEMBLY_ACC=CAM_ASM_000379 /LENGTH=85 /DNA_ID=CAMNT_0028216249 /DNA_START=466 /DNA_END=723 /DNA_ORIENTATION=-